MEDTVAPIAGGHRLMRSKPIETNQTLVLANTQRTHKFGVRLSECIKRRIDHGALGGSGLILLLHAMRICQRQGRATAVLRTQNVQKLTHAMDDIERMIVGWARKTINEGWRRGAIEGERTGHSTWKKLKGWVGNKYMG